MCQSIFGAAIIIMPVCAAHIYIADLFDTLDFQLVIIFFCSSRIHSFFIAYLAVQSILIAFNTDSTWILYIFTVQQSGSNCLHVTVDIQCALQWFQNKLNIKIVPGTFQLMSNRVRNFEYLTMDLFHCSIILFKLAIVIFLSYQFHFFRIEPSSQSWRFQYFNKIKLHARKKEEVQSKCCSIFTCKKLKVINIEKICNKSKSRYMNDVYSLICFV